MSPRIIYKQGDWTVIQDPLDNGRDDLVRFRRHNGKRCLLDQIAQWDGTGWSDSRWVPRSPKVTTFMLSWVEAHMRNQP